jgi:phosphoglycolate phosphatase
VTGNVPIKFVVFDLDGTLVDGYAAISDALSWTMRRMGFLPPPPEAVRRMVGEGLERLLEKNVGAARAEEGVRLFRERYPEVAVPMTDLVPGVRRVLRELEQSGRRMAVASNKPARFSKMILEAKAVSSYFFEIAGPDGETPPKPDPTMLRGLLHRAGFTPDETLVVGDMEIDAAFARAAGCRVALAPGGSRTRQELEAERPDALLDSLLDLTSWLENGKATADG